MKQYFAYIRVSTTRQGEFGVSLPQQKDAIERYAQRNQLEITHWFEEQETAAKQGRPIFGTMVKLLRKQQACGVIIHKIDRSARNLRDWADLGELIDRGVEVHFANESLDLTSRGGRLSADIQAVVASDFIRNLREETKKGIYGRLKQGYYPMPAPLGYLDNGAAKPKTPDPKIAPLVRQAFELYASRRFSLRTLGPELHRLGLRRPDGKPYLRNRLSKLLNNPFYSGLIRVKKTGEHFAGVHEPLVSRAVFEQVQAVMAGKTNTVVRKNDFLYRRRLRCKGCQYSLIGERQKGITYYRCHTETCPTACVREDAVESAILNELARIQLSPAERRYLLRELERMRGDATGQRQATVAGLKLRLSQVDDRIGRLTDAFIDRLIEEALFEARKKTLLSERLDLQAQIANWQDGKRDASEEVAQFIERADSACLAYKSGTVEEKRDLLDALTSNRIIDGKIPVIMLSLSFRAIAERPKSADGAPSRAAHRVWKPLIARLKKMFESAQGYRKLGKTSEFS
ncbi:MAG TPA: recombinase family protein [Bryobacteraceae bacterium]|jgi:DNA invertase Pin-like site-specific DNA recombinase|nr:recombinase family protein [Bryobacteraceae bacterium]